MNKVNSAAVLRWNLVASEAFTEEQKNRLFTKLENRLTKEGDLIIRSDEFRDQERNRSQCIKRLHSILETALTIPKKRIPTKPTRSSQRKRLESKRNLSETKTLRKKVTY